VTGLPLPEKAGRYLARLCLDIPNRRTGSAGNRAATDLFAATVSALGWETVCPEFDCIDWEQEGAELSAGGERFEVQVSPFSPGGACRAPVEVISTVEELEATSLTDRIVLLRGEIAREQLMPKEFTFYNPDEHKRTVRALESARPLAIVAATGRNPEMAGAAYPFPLIEDGDFDIPSVYMKDVEGERLAALAGKEAVLDIRAQRRASTGCNVVARRTGGTNHRAVLFAHVDAKEGTPGALDNASGVTVLLLLAELLAGYAGGLGIELVAINGEDYYAASGEKQWLSFNEGRFGEIVLGINLDGVGNRGGQPAYSLYGCPPELAGLIRQALGAYPGMVEGEAWYQSDHSLFLMQGVPALALTSQQFTELWSEVAHTAADRPEIVDPDQLVTIAWALRDLLNNLSVAA
jgi:aminopeptidase YwaD